MSHQKSLDKLKSIVDELQGRRVEPGSVVLASVVSALIDVVKHQDEKIDRLQSHGPSTPW